MLRTIIEQNPIEKIPLERPRMHWEDDNKKLEQLAGGINQKILGMNKEGQRFGCETGWS